ncbi:MAG: tetraacyldisaccharide 4'-kinase [Fidelibacterota bacterium]
MRLLNTIIVPLAGIYGCIMTVRNILYDRGWFPVRTLPAVVISIGNITMGGTGKTPVTVALAMWLCEKGYKVAILSRGYGRKTRGTFIGSEKSTWQELGDEPSMMRDILDDVPIVVDENRFRGGRILVDIFQPDVILLDDAFQHRSLHRDLDLLVISAGDRQENYSLFPAGRLREAWRHAHRADAILLTKSEWYDLPQDVDRKISALSRPVFQLTAETVLQSPYGPIESCDAPFILVCAIADPESFRRAAGRKYLDIAKEFIFPDHYHYTRADVDKIEAWDDTGKTAGILTTEKDYVKLKRLRLSKPLYVLTLRYNLPVELQDVIVKALS